MKSLTEKTVFKADDGRIVTIVPRRGASGLTLRRKKNELTLTVPYGYPAGLIEPKLREMLSRFDAKYPDAFKPRYRIGQVINCHGLDIELYSQNVRPNHVVIGAGVPLSRLGVGERIDLSSPEAEQFLSDVLCKLAYRLAPQLILPQAIEASRRVGVSPESWRIGRGLKILGTCSARRVITLSCALVFLPVELREYVICHELAHLSEMNHSARFHAVCNAYLNGLEKSLAASLRRHTWPILR